MSTYRYPCIITCDEAGFYLVKFTDLPGAATDGKTREEALVEAEDCLAEAIAGYLVRRERVPEPSCTDDDTFVSLDPLLAAKAALNNAMLEAGLTRTDLAARLGVDEKIVRRLLDPKHQSHIRAVLHAASLLGLKAEVRLSVPPSGIFGLLLAESGRRRVSPPSSHTTVRTVPYTAVPVSMFRC
jgi:antitoxin HicB